MSTSSNQGDGLPPSPANYAPGTGPDRYARFAEDWLPVTRTWVLDQLSAALDQHKQIVAMGGNGVGKSLSAATLGTGGLYCNKHTTVPITAGNGGTVENSIWKPIKNFHNKSQLPGRIHHNRRELRTEIDEKWYLQCLSPRHPEALEGDHNDTVIYIIEEAEKPDVSAEHIDSARSTLTSENDRILVLANPPTDESNVVNDLLKSDEWYNLIFPSWDSHNIRIHRGLQDGEEIKGISTPWKIQQDWLDYHEEEWPGLERAIEISTPYVDADGNLTVYEHEAVDDNPEFRDDLHSMWYKRRAGIVPPDSSSTWRPWSVSDVEAAYNRTVTQGVRETPSHLGIDVARGGGDRTIMTGLHGPKSVVHYNEQGTDHHEQRLEVQPDIKEWPNPHVNVDAVGEGSAFADELNARLPNINRFSNGKVAADEDNYRYKWDEGLQLIGEWLRDGGSFSDSDLYEELKIAARVIKFRVNSLASRGDVIEATPKDDLKEELGHSPDYLDSLLMALYAKEHEDGDKPSPVFGR